MKSMVGVVGSTVDYEIVRGRSHSLHY